MRKRSWNGIGIRHDLTSQIFGRLTVIEHVGHNKRRLALWRCLCVCGRETIVTSNGLRCGGSRSCGCLVKDRTKEVNSKPDKVVIASWVYSCVKGSAEGRNIEFSLSKRWTVKTCMSACHYCGVVGGNRQSTKRRVILWNGIDRKDPNKGYTTKNCVSCCGKCNYAKGTLTYEEFIDLIRSIHTNMKL